MLHTITALCMLIMGQSCLASMVKSEPKATPEELHILIKEICLKKMNLRDDVIPETIENYLIPHYKVDWKEHVPLLEQKQLSLNDQVHQINIKSPARKWLYAIDPTNPRKIKLSSLNRDKNVTVSFNENKHKPLNRANQRIFFSPDETMLGVITRNQENNKAECLVYNLNDLNPDNPTRYELDVATGNHPYTFACKFNKKNTLCALASEHHVDIHNMKSGNNQRLSIEQLSNMEFTHDGNYLIISNQDENQITIYNPLTQEKRNLNEQYFTTIDKEQIVTRRQTLMGTRLICHNLRTKEEYVMQDNENRLAQAYGSFEIVASPSNNVKIVHNSGNLSNVTSESHYYLLCKNQARKIIGQTKITDTNLSDNCLISDNGRYVAHDKNRHITMYYIHNDNRLEELASHANNVPNGSLMHINWNGQKISLLDKRAHTLYTYGYNTNRGFTGMTHEINPQPHTISRGRIFWNDQMLHQNQASCMNNHDLKRGIAHIIDLVQPRNLILEASDNSSKNHLSVITNNNAEYAISSLDTKL